MAMNSPMNFDAETYQYLHKLAARMRKDRNRPYDSIQPTELVHEAWEKLNKTDGNGDGYDNRCHFLATAARAMRFILVDRARARGRLKRPDPRFHTSLAGISEEMTAQIDILDLDQALEELARLDSVAADVITLRIFGGLTLKETAEELGLGLTSIKKHWRFARVWLKRRLS